MPCSIFSPPKKSYIFTMRTIHTDWALSNYSNHRAQVLYTTTIVLLCLLSIYIICGIMPIIVISYWNSNLLILNASENREQPNAHSCPSLTPLPAAGGRIFLLNTEMLPDEIWILFLQFNYFFVWVTEILSWTGDMWSLEEAQRMLIVILFKYKQLRQKMYLDGYKIIQPLSLSYIQN